MFGHLSYGGDNHHAAASLCSILSGRHLGLLALPKNCFVLLQIHFSDYFSSVDCTTIPFPPATYTAFTDSLTSLTQGAGPTPY